ncbi:hypothetical protein B484DRAFT_397389, partial [Ochromonadaceae sp. CCMP2298]
AAEVEEEKDDEEEGDEGEEESEEGDEEEEEEEGGEQMDVEGEEEEEEEGEEVKDDDADEENEDEEDKEGGDSDAGQLCEGSDEEDEAEEVEEVGAAGAGAGEEEERKPVESNDVTEGCTVFLRGLPFDAESADLKRALSKFGRITVAVVVKDRVTGMSKGTAFVKFASADLAERCIAESLGGLMVKDRTCRVDLAVERNTAQGLKETEAARRGKDRRNLYLANEGLLLAGMEDEGAVADPKRAKAIAKMSEADKEKRQRAQQEKRKKLQNPLFFVSSNRLSLRNLSKEMTDKELRELCLEAARTGIKRNLVTRKDVESLRQAQGMDRR